MSDYLDLLKSIFDFSSLKTLLQRKDFKILVDAMHGVTGPYFTRILVNELGVDSKSIMNAIPLEDFGG